MSDAVKLSSELFDDIELTREYDNRIIFLTDAQVNTGEVDVNFFKAQLQKNAKQRIYTTFIGIGIDLQTSLIEAITRTRGANHFSVRDQESFSKLLDDDFELVMTPIVFNLELRFKSDYFEIEHVFGSPDDVDSTDQLMKLNTLFPARTQADGTATRGGIVLLKLKIKKNVSNEVHNLQLTVTYEDREGHVTKDERSVDIIDQHTHSTNIDPSHLEPFYSDKGIRKGILLVEYVTLLKKWIRHERNSLQNEEQLTRGDEDEDASWLYRTTVAVQRRWERSNTPLKVSPSYRDIFGNFKRYFEQEKAALQDEDLQQEISILDKLSSYDK
ncbi:unnamed protein product [Rotaria sp. Silwood2]|nr:unnamed protein product [Rotaria sp. Silwood2]CAF4664511.1 unnamed protein product [Rotaria sp. Silwood2]